MLFVLKRKDEKPVYINSFHVACIEADMHHPGNPFFLITFSGGGNKSFPYTEENKKVIDSILDTIR